MAEDEDDVRSEEALAAAAQAGDDAAFLRLVARLAPYVARLLAAHLADPGLVDLDEVARQTFDAAYDALARLDDPALVRVWLGTIALRHLHDELARRRPLVPLDALDGRAMPHAARVEDDRTGVLVDDALAALGPALRPVVRLYAEGYTTGEIAARLGRRHAAVKRGLARARRALRILYARDAGDRPRGGTGQGS